MARKQPADLGREPDLLMGQAAERIEQHLGPAPRWSGGREIEQHFSLDPAESSVDMGLLGELFLEEAYP
jgi:hypothetical protein